MIKVNLLPVRVSRRQEAVKKELVLGGIGLALVLLLCTVLYVLLAANVNDVRAENSRLEKDLENLKAIVARVDEIEKFNEELKRKLAVIDELRANKVGPVHLLDELSNATPEKLYLRSMKEKQRKITLSGLASSNEVIAQFLQNLEKSDWFDEVYLNGIAQQNIGGLNLKEFEVTARLVAPAEKARRRAATQAPLGVTGTGEPTEGGEPGAPAAPGSTPEGAPAAPATGAPAAPAASPPTEGTAPSLPPVPQGGSGAMKKAAAIGE